MEGVKSSAYSGSASSDPGALNAQLLEQFPATASVRDREPKQFIERLARLDETGAAFGTFARALLTKGRLSPTTRELVVLWIAWLRQCGYVWGGHALIAADVGFHFPGPEETWDAEQRLALRVASELLDGPITDDLRNEAISTWGEPGLLELAMIVGQYMLVCMSVAAMGLHPEPGVPGLPEEWPGPAVAPTPDLAA